MITQECKISFLQIPNIWQQKPSNISRYKIETIVDGKTGLLLKYQHLSKHPKYKETWKHSYGNEIGRLAQGMLGQVNGMNTMFSIKKDELPQNRFRDVTYWQIICDYHGKESRTKQDKIHYWRQQDKVPPDCGTPTADLLTIK